MSCKDTDNIRVLICRDEPLDLQEGVKFVSSPKCGAINTFTGIVRDTDSSSKISSSMPIDALFYEAYESMALKQIFHIIENEINESPDGSSDQNSRGFVALRLGRVPVQEAAIIICISSTGRAMSHRAVMSILEKIKKLAPIWKKVIFSDGTEEWANIKKSEAFWLSDDKE